MSEDRKTPPVPTNVLATPRVWTVPRLTELPKLSSLTLASEIGGGGGTGGGGSTVFALLLSFLLAGCHGEANTAPGGAPTRVLSAPITCTADVAAGTVDCDGPELIGDAAIGGQGRVMALRSSNVSYNSGTEIFQFDVTLQNLGAQTLGGDGTGTSVFFVSGPTVTLGSGTADVDNEDGIGTFSAPGQPFFLYPDSLKKGATSVAKTWQLSMPPTVTSFTFTVLISSWFFDESGVLVWTKVPGFSQTSYRDLAVNSATDAMIVGTNGLVLRKTGSTWSTLPAQVSGQWVGVEAIGNGQYIGATSAGGIYRFDGKVWIELAQFGEQTYALTAYAADRIGASTASSLRWYGNNGWYVIGYAGPPHIYMGNYDLDQGVAATGDGSIVRFNFNSPIPSGSSIGYNITAFGSGYDIGFLYALDAGGPEAHLWDDAVGGYILNGATDTTIVAASYGSGGTRWIAAKSASSGETRLMRYSGGVWTSQVTLPDTLIGLQADSAGGVYLLSASRLRRWDGATLTNDVGGAPGTLTSVDGKGSLAIVGTSTGEVWRYAGGAWTSWSVSGVGIQHVAIAGANDAFAVDDNDVFYDFDGATWSSVGAPMDNTNGLAALGSGWAAIAGGVGPSIRMLQLWDGATFTPDIQGTVPNWRAVWGGDAANVWAVSPGGRVRRWDGSTFFDQNVGDTTRVLTAVSGTSAGDVWVGDSTGGVQLWDGSSWNSCPFITPGPIRGLWSSGPAMAYVQAGPAGGVYAVTMPCNVRWLPIDSTAGMVTKIAGSSSNNAWALVGGQLYHGQR